jgi:hypothetical protein
VKKIFVAILAIVAALSLGACTSKSDYEIRKEQNKTKLIHGESMEQKNLKEKIRRDEASADKIGYVYIMSFGKFIGYYTIKGKISSDGSQLNPQDDIICRYSSDSCQAVDGPQDAIRDVGGARNLQKVAAGNWPAGNYYGPTLALIVTSHDP